MMMSTRALLIALGGLAGVACIAFAVGRWQGMSSQQSATAARPTATPIALVVITTANPAQAIAVSRTAIAAIWETALAFKPTPGPSSTPWPTETPPPTETPLPVDKRTGAKVVVSASLGPGETAAEPTMLFSTSTTQVYCVATFRAIGPNAVIAFRYLATDTGATIWQSSAGDILPPIISVERGTSRATFLQGPLNAGTYRCDLLINDKVVSSAPFRVSASLTAEPPAFTPTPQTPQRG